MAVGDRQSQGPRKVSPFVEIGTSGLRQWSGWVLDEWLGELQGREAAWRYREFLDNDPIAGGFLFMIEMLAQRVDYSVEGGEPRWRNHIEQSMHDMSHGWDDFICEALTHLPYGYAAMEEVFKYRRGEQPGQDEMGSDDETPTTEEPQHPGSSAYTDGLVGWRKLPLRAQETTLHWHFDGYSSLRGLEQLDWHGGHHNIPITKLVLIRNRRVRNNPEGYSILRRSWPSFFRLRGLQDIEAVGAARDLAGIPIAKPPPGVDLFAQENTELYNRVTELVTTVHRDEDEGLVFPTAEWEFELMSAAGSRQFDLDKVIRRYEQRIAASVAADFMLLGQDGLGSYAMVDVKSELFGMAVDAMIDQILKPMNRYAIPRLLRLNGVKTNDPPKIVATTAGRIDLEKVGLFLSNMAAAGLTLPDDPKFKKQLFESAGLGSDFTFPVAPAKPVEPAKPAAGKLEPSKLQKDAAQVGKGTGMVSLDLVPGTLPAMDDGVQDHHLTVVLLGSDVDDETFAQAVETARSVAATTKPPKGTVGGQGTFEPSEASDGKVPVYAVPKIAGLDKLRAAFEPLNASEHSGFRPHVTLTYQDEGDPLPDPLPETPIKFTHLSVHRGEEVLRVPFGQARLAKADGQVIDVGPALATRARVLSGALDGQMTGLLQELGSRAASAYLTTVRKGELPTGKREMRSVTAKVVRSLGIAAWVQQRLTPALAAHAGRVARDTELLLKTETGLDLAIADADIRRIKGSRKLSCRDIEPQVRQAILKAVEAGVQAGEDPGRTAQRIRKAVPAGRFVKAGVGYRSELIAANETAAMQRAASLVAYGSSPRVVGLQTHGGDRDGETFLLADAPSAPHVGSGLSYNPVVTPEA
jgi:2'-5' RNA ligase